MAAMLPSEKPYLKTGVLALARTVWPGFRILMISSMITGSILAKYEAAFAVIPLLVTFIPMLTDTGGNAGSQSSTMIIRGMAVGELKPGISCGYSGRNCGWSHCGRPAGTGQLYTAGNPFSRTGNALPYSGTEPFSHRHAGQNHWMCPAHCSPGSPSGPSHHGCPAYYHHCGCGEPDYIFSAGLQPAEDLGRMFRAGILFLYRIPAFCFDGFSHLVPGYLVLSPILAPQFVNPQNPLLTMGNRFYYNKGKL